MRNRRSFFKKISAGLAVLGLGMRSHEVEAANVKIQGTLVHHVYFWLKDPKNESDLRKLQEGLETLLDIKEIKMSHIGVPAGTENRDVVDHSYSVSYMVVFENLKDQDSYQKDPIHLRFVDKYAYLWDRVVVYDSIN